MNLVLIISQQFKNPQTAKRVRIFLGQRKTVISIFIFLGLIFLSLTAELWANSRPIYLKCEDKHFFPVFVDYPPSQLGINNMVVTDYRSANLRENCYAVWPLIEWDPFEANASVTSYPAPPSDANWFGTDDRGRDVLARLLYGFRYSIGFAVLVWLSSYMLGVLLGAIMGYAGGLVDLLGQRIVEVFDTIPVFLILLTLVSIFGASLQLLVGLSALFGWMMISVYIRAEFLKLRNREFVEAARSLGLSHFRIIRRHILPNALGPILTFSPFAIAGGISALAALDYLGFGLPPPTPSWGELLQQANQHFTRAWWLAVYPSLALFLNLVVVNLIGEGVRDAMDPRHGLR